jgi:hypothetical protein
MLTTRSLTYLIEPEENAHDEEHAETNDEWCGKASL